MIEKLLQAAITARASDLHITVGVPPVLRIGGQLIRTAASPLTERDAEIILTELLTDEQLAEFQQRRDIDFPYALAGSARFRVNGFFQRGFPALAIRIIKEDTPHLEQGGYPPVLRTIAGKRRGLVLVTGPAGSGKTTTLAAMVDWINANRACHIITLEDPIEFVHVSQKSIINQREVSTDTESFARALKAVLRQDPDVILVGEMRDRETIGTVLTAAETGHLVLATLHTFGAVNAVDRIVDAFSPEHQYQIRVQLSLTLEAVVAQQLLPASEKSGLVMAMEILLATPAVRNLIREGKSHQLKTVIQTGGKFGMQSMGRAINDLCQQGLISAPVARVFAEDEAREGF